MAEATYSTQLNSFALKTENQGVVLLYNLTCAELREQRYVLLPGVFVAHTITADKYGTILKVLPRLLFKVCVSVESNPPSSFGFNVMVSLILSRYIFSTSPLDQGKVRMVGQ